MFKCLVLICLAELTFKSSPNVMWMNLAFYYSCVSFFIGNQSREYRHLKRKMFAALFSFIKLRTVSGEKIASFLNAVSHKMENV